MPCQFGITSDKSSEEYNLIRENLNTKIILKKIPSLTTKIGQFSGVSRNTVVRRFVINFTLTVRLISTELNRKFILNQIMNNNPFPREIRTVYTSLEILRFVTGTYDRSLLITILTYKNPLEVSRDHLMNIIA